MKQILHPEKGTKKNISSKVFNLLTLVLTAMIYMSFSGVYAQRTLNVTGGSAIISGDVYAYSIGEMVLVSTVETSNLFVTQGLLQSNVDEMGVLENNFLAEGMNIYPNPVGNILYLQPSLSGGGKLSLLLFDLRGRLILQRRINLQTGSERQQLNLSSLQEGTYLLQANLQQENRTYNHRFKILKLGD